MTLPPRIFPMHFAVAMLAGLLVLAPLTSPRAASLPEEGAPSRAVQRSREDERPAACADDCTRKASDCIDACEEKFKDDDRGRVTCKFECATKRQQCEKDCQ
jgi:hypothetical protein